MWKTVGLPLLPNIFCPQTWKRNDSIINHLPRTFLTTVDIKFFVEFLGVEKINVDSSKAFGLKHFCEFNQPNLSLPSNFCQPQKDFFFLKFFCYLKRPRIVTFRDNRHPSNHSLLARFFWITRRRECAKLFLITKMGFFLVWCLFLVKQRENSWKFGTISRKKLYWKKQGVKDQE